MTESYRFHLERLEQQVGALAAEFTRVQLVRFGPSPRWQPPINAYLCADRFDLPALIVGDYERKRGRSNRLIRSMQFVTAWRQAAIPRPILAVYSPLASACPTSSKRPLTMRMAWKLHREWDIPAEALIAPPRTRGRKSAA